MARAKRTHRADARKRYRAQVAAGEVPAGSAAERPPATGASAPAPERPSITYAFRAAFRRADLATDLRLLPQLILHRSVWVPAAISVGAMLLIFVTGGKDIVSQLLWQYFIITPPVGAIFLSGFLAPRASYLTGAISGLVGALCLTVLLTTGTIHSPTQGGFGGAVPLPSESAAASPSESAGASPSASGSPAASPSEGAPGSAAPSPAPSGDGTTPTPIDEASLITSALVISPVTGVLFGSAAAWYRRFLNLANPNRARAQAQRRRQQPRRR